MGSEVLLDEITVLSLDIDHEPEHKVLEDLEDEGVGVEEGGVEDEDETINVAVSEFSGDAIKLYLREVQKTKLLTAADEKDLATKIALGDKAARNQMIVANLRLVRWL